MRILIVTATKPGGSRAPAETFVRHVKDSFKKSLRAHEKIEFIVRQHTELLEFLPPPPVPPAEADITASKYCIAAFDGLDLVFIDGDEQLLPWVPAVAPLLKLLHLCVLAKKCVFGCGCAVQLLAYLVQVGSAQVPVLNGGGLGGALDEFRPPPLGSSSERGDGSASEGVMLDNRTGDMFRWLEPGAAIGGGWSPVGNVGVHAAFGKVSLGKASDVSLGSAMSEINRSDGVGSCEVTRLARFHFLFKGLYPHKFMVPQKNQWHCHLGDGATLPLPTGDVRVRALARSGFGAQVLEACNVTALQLRLSERHPHTLSLLHNFVEEKVALLGGERGPDVPKGILERQAREIGSDLLQQVINALKAEPVLAGAGGFEPSNAASAARAMSASSSQPGSVGASHKPSRPPSAMRGNATIGGGGGGGAAAAAARPGSAMRPGSAPQLRKASRPGSAAGSVARSTNSGGGGGGGGGGYLPHPTAAMTYLAASDQALNPFGGPHMRRTTTARLGLPGVANEMPMFAPKPPMPVGEERAVLARRATKLAEEEAARTAISPGMASMMAAQKTSQESSFRRPSLVRRDDDSDAGRGKASLEATPQLVGGTGEMAPQLPPSQGQVRRVSVKKTAPFCNYHKYVAHHAALAGASPFVTTVGPYDTDYDRKRASAIEEQDNSIHPKAFVPGGLWEKFDPSQTGIGGNRVPGDMPASQHRGHSHRGAPTYHTYYNVGMHEFRPRSSEGAFGAPGATQARRAGVTQ